ncbi:MAG TPA: diacylglycerol kinase family protein [Pseudonocardia sp.]
MGRSDRAISGAIARLPVTDTDAGLRKLTATANHGGLWFAVAAVLAARQGVTRRAALRGIISVGGASFLANVVLKTMLPRRRPAAELLPEQRRLVRRPTSSSFPSGHAASAAAFATAVAMESPRSALVVGPLAATVAYSRVHTGVHWSSDVLAGAAVGSGVAMATRRWWPVRTADEARARTVHEAPAMADGKGLVVMVNPVSGDGTYDPTDDVSTALPAATVIRTEKGRDAAELLEEALTARTEPAEALGVAGGDGTVGSVAAVAVRHGLPLAVIPAGTLNHFARDVGVYDLREVVDATGAGEAVAVDVATVEFDDGNGPRTHHWLNTASLGAYPDLVRLREKWEDRWGKWPSFAAALVVTLRGHEPLRMRVDGTWHSVWFLFIGNGPYHPRGAIPGWRSRLDSGMLDVRWLRADLRFSRSRAVFALALSALGHSKVYGERLTRELTVELPEAEPLATDGEVLGETKKLRFAVTDPIPVYRRNEDNPRWADRDRPHHPQ